MTLQQLRYATAVADYKSINKASQILFVSQSSLSSGIANLEQEIGLSIFRRTNHGVSVTPEGGEFLMYARQIVGQYQLVEEKYVLKQNYGQSFSISTQYYTFAIDAFIHLAEQFCIDDYQFGIYECRTQEIMENVRNYKSELGILYIDDFNRDILTKLLEEKELEYKELFDCGTYVLMADTHPLSQKKQLKLEELSLYPFLSFDQGNDQSFYLSEEVYSTYAYRQVIKTSDRATMLNLMKGLNGYTLSSGILGEELNGTNYVAVPLHTNKRMHIGYIRRKGSAISGLGRIYIEELNKSCNIYKEENEVNRSNT